MKILVKAWHPDIPEWPLECVEVEDDHKASDGETLFTLEEYKAHRESLQEKYFAWESSAACSITREETITSIKQEAQRRVLNVTGSSGIPIEDVEVWVPKQLNPIATFCYLLWKKVNGQALSADENTMVTMVTLWGKIAAIRSYSNDLEKRFLGGESINIDKGWPE